MSFSFFNGTGQQSRLLDEHNFYARYCGDSLWFQDELGELLPNVTVVPRLSWCFQHAVLASIPPLFLLIMLPVVLIQVRISKAPVIPWSLHASIKAMMTIVLIVAKTCLVVRSVWQSVFFHENVPIVEYVYPVLHVVTYATLMDLTRRYRKAGMTAPSIIFLTWLLFVVTSIPEFYSLFETGTTPTLVADVDTYRYIVYIASFPLSVIQLIVHSIAEKSFDNLDPRLCPETTSGFLSRQFVSWFSPIVSQGYKKSLTQDDLYSLERDMVAPGLFSEWLEKWTPLVTAYNEAKHKAVVSEALTMVSYDESIMVSDSTPLLYTEKDNGQSAGRSDAGYGAVQDNPKSGKSKTKLPEPPSIVWLLFGMFKWSFLGATVIKFCSDMLQFANPLLLSLLISYAEQPSAPLYQGLSIAVLLFVAGEMRSFFMNNYFTMMFRTGIKIQSVLTTAVFDKALRLSSGARQQRTLGEIVNLMAIDVERFQQLANQCQQFWSTPLSVIVTLILLYQTIGIAFIGGVVVMLLLVPLNMLLSIKTKKWLRQMMQLRDERQKMTTEVLNGIRVVKLYAWEAAMERVIEDIRKREVALIRKSALFRTIGDMLTVGSPFLVAIVAFTTYLMSSENEFTPSVAFVSLSLFQTLRGPLMMFTELIGLTINTMISNKRLKDYLVEDELDPEAVQRDQNPEYTRSIDIENASFSWDGNSNDSAPILKNLNLSVPTGSLIAVIGRVGSGKSSLLSAILGEMDKLHGYVGVRGRSAYAAQQAWIQNVSLQNNILFGAQFNAHKYRSIIDSCELGRDLEILPHGDETEIGEKGINLSGGQKARVGLARAVYQDCDVYFLDDPLSAVDAIVGKAIFENVIGPKGLLKNKTRLLVTHNLSYLTECDLIVVMDGGEITHTGTYNELMTDENVADILKTIETESDDEDALSTVASGEDSDADARPPGAIGVSVRRSTGGGRRTTRKSTRRSTVSEHDSKAARPLVATTMQTEAMETGQVGAKVYFAYFKAMNLRYAILFFVFVVANAATVMLRGLWLSAWSDSTVLYPPDERMPDSKRLAVYGTMGASEIIFLYIGMAMMIIGSTRAGLNLHHPLLANILKAPLQFFDTTPLGRILNRTGKDMEIVDLKLMGSFRMLAIGAMSVCQTLIIVSYSTPLFLVIIIPIAFIYIGILKYFIASSRQLQRLSSVSRSPLYAQFGETIQGASTIRAFNVGEQFFDKFCIATDTHITSKYFALISNRWLAVRLEIIGNFVILCAAVLATLAKEWGVMTPGALGLSVSYALNITFMLNMLIRQVSDVETNIVSVERIKEYSAMPTEADWFSSDESKKPPWGWPTQGKIAFEEFSARYRPELDLALRDVTAAVKATEKIGIAGRTGAGKSSLTLALFRIIEASKGRILIDGVDIASIGLHELRSRLAIIPQDPVLFSGTLRFNLDPFGTFSDDALWAVLEDAHLKQFIDSKPDGLSFVIAEGGENVSVGQRQLVCLARALLRRSKILVLDEATASVDHHTDALIQRTITNKFSDSTVVTIAHRVNTILNYDRVMVLDRGKVVELDPPDKLLKNPNSLFAKMAKHTE